MKSDLPDTLDTDEVRALREKRAELRAKLQTAKAETEQARAADAAARKEVERLDTAAELGEASLKEIKAARSERSQTLERLETAEAGANLEAKRRALSKLEERLEEAQAEARREAAEAYGAAFHAHARRMLDGFEELLSAQAGVERLQDEARACGLRRGEIPKLAREAAGLRFFPTTKMDNPKQKRDLLFFVRHALEQTGEEAGEEAGRETAREALHAFARDHGATPKD